VGSETNLAKVRRSYAELLRERSQIRSAALVEAFATVPRERFLGPGPWQIMTASEGRFGYHPTPDADPAHLYCDELVAIDAARFLNNGLPSALAGWIDALDLVEGESVVHVGSGTGYYTAIFAEVVGAEGRVAAIEIDAGLAEKARRNLSYLRQVEISTSDEAGLQPGRADAVFVNAGATHPRLAWIESLRDGGRLLVPITAAPEVDGIGAGGMFLITRRGASFEARLVSGVMIFPCLGARDEELNRQLSTSGRDWTSVRSLRVDPHEPDESCWLHARECCMSRSPVSAG
jgi:protein-L-isoaspartate(D-aspartate) O-methyltransferase